MTLVEPVFRAADRNDFRIGRTTEETLSFAARPILAEAADITDCKRAQCFSLSNPLDRPSWMSEVLWSSLRKRIDEELIISAFLKSCGTNFFSALFKSHYRIGKGAEQRTALFKSASNIIHREIGECRLAGVSNRLTYLGWVVVQTAVWAVLSSALNRDQDKMRRSGLLLDLLQLGIPIANRRDVAATWLFLVG
jgi:hypothetical protein